MNPGDTTPARASTNHAPISRTAPLAAAIARNGGVRTPATVGALPPIVASPSGAPRARANWKTATTPIMAAAATAASSTGVTMSF